MIKHVFTIIWNQRRSNAWLVVELFIISISFWFIVDYTGIMLHIKNTPTGFDISHTYKVLIREYTPESDRYIMPENKQTLLGEDILTIMEHLRQHPSIESVSASVGSQPYGSILSESYRQLAFNDTAYILAQEYRVTPSFFDVFRITAAEGQNSILKDVLNATNVIISADLEKELAPGTSMLGKQITIGENEYNKQVEAVSHPIRRSEFRLSTPCYYTLLSDNQIVNEVNSENLHHLEICIRIKPEADKAFADRFIEEMSPRLDTGNLFLLDVRSSLSIRQRIIQGELSQFFINTFLLIFLSLNIFLGVFGAFIVRTQQRRGEIGLRIALGSSRPKIGLVLFLEGILLLTIASLPAILIDLNIGMLELLNVYWKDFSFTRFLIGTGFTYIVILCMILTGIWYPAYRCSKVQPAEALHYE